MPLTAYTCYRFLCFCCKTRLEFSVLQRTDSATCDINSCRVSSEGSSFDVSRYSLIPISFIIAHKIKLSLINIQIFSENLLPYLPALFFSGHKNTLFMTWKNTHGLLWKIQAIYFEISALYFLQKSVSDFQQLTKAVKCGFPHLFFRLFRRSLSLSETDCGVRCCTLLILFCTETAEKRTFAFGLPNKAMDEHSHAGKKPQIAVVNRNTLAANGLTSLIEGVMPMAEVAVFNNMSDIPESLLSGFFHFFISPFVFSLLYHTLNKKTLVTQTHFCAP